MTRKPVYITKEGLKKMREELAYLKTTKKREVADRIEKAKELGDLKENAEYHDAKDEMGFVHGRIVELEDQVNRAEVIEKTDTDSVGIGSKVTVKYGPKEKEKTLSIVGSAEADPLEGRVSNESPLGEALLGKRIGEKAEVEAPAGIITYTVLAIE